MYVHTPENLDYSYKAYFGFGNNSCMLKSILRRRNWWSIIDANNTDKSTIADCHFVWTQLKANYLFSDQVKRE